MMVKKKKRGVIKRKSKGVVKKDLKEEEKPEKIYLCPKCRSKKVKKVFSFRTLFGLFSRWKCEKCGYSDVIFPLLNKRLAK